MFVVLETDDSNYNCRKVKKKLLFRIEKKYIMSREFTDRRIMQRVTQVFLVHCFADVC